VSTDRNAASKLGIEPAILVDIYRQMARIRAVDKAIQAGLSSGKFLFSYWPLTGQEAIPATIAQLTSARDYMVTTYRGIHDQVGKGLDLEGLFAEAVGRETGVNKGKGGSPHISDPKSGSMLTTAIVGAGAPIANGLAFAAKSRGEDRVTIVNFGDGATSIGAVHEAMNFAGSWKLPVIFLCQNNQYGEYTRLADYTASQDFASRAAGYGFKGVKLDGNDPVAFYHGMKAVIDEVRAGKGPVFVEALTYRLGPHAGVGDNQNAAADELKARKELDIKRESLRKLLGHVPAELAELTPQPTLPTVRPETADEWVAIAEKHNPQLASVRFAAEEAEQELQRARGSHHPTVDFVAGYSMTRTTGSVYTDSASRAELYSYGVQVEVPLYKGGALNSQVREAASLRDKAKEDLEEVRRTVALETRQAFLEVTHSLAEMKAMEQALRSAELQLSSTKSGLNAGVRTTTDLLQAEQQVFAAKRDLARARYAYCTKIVQLHAAAGTADEEILAVINALLAGAQGTASKT